MLYDGNLLLNSVNLIVKKSSFVLLLVALIFQNSIALVLSSISGSGVSLVFLSKEMVISLTVFLTLLFKSKFEITKPDRIVLILVCSYIVLSLLTFNGLPPLLYGIKYFVIPMILYATGRYWFHDLDTKTIFELFTIAIFTVIVLSIAYLLIDKNLLLDLNIWTVFESKGQDVTGGRFLDGFPVNFYSYYGDYRLMRLFGPFFDPLSTGFFLVPLLFFAKQQAWGKGIAWKLIYIVLFILLLLTQTRAILLAYIATLFFLRSGKEGYKLMSIKWIVVSIMVIIAAVVANYNILLKFVDPSTWGHLKAYYRIFTELKDESFFTLLLGRGIPEDLNIGNESLFTSMIAYNGLLYFFIFNCFIVSVFKNLSRNVNAPLNYVVLASMIAYYLASFTTEHWFATTSSGLFWVLLGMAVQNSTSRDRASRHAVYLKFTGNAA